MKKVLMWILIVILLALVAYAVRHYATPQTEVELPANLVETTNVIEEGEEMDENTEEAIEEVEEMIDDILEDVESVDGIEVVEDVVETEESIID